MDHLFRSGRIKRLRSRIATFFVAFAVATVGMSVSTSSHAGDYPTQAEARAQCEEYRAKLMEGTTDGVTWSCEGGTQGGYNGFYLWQTLTNGAHQNTEKFWWYGDDPDQCKAGQFVAGAWPTDGSGKSCRGSCATEATIQIGGQDPTFGTVTTGEKCSADSAPPQEGSPDPPPKAGYTPDDPNDPGKGGTYCTSSPTVCVHGDAPNTGGSGGSTGGGSSGGGSTGDGSAGGGTSGGGSSGGDTGGSSGGDAGGSTGGGSSGGGSSGGGSSGGGSAGGDSGGSTGGTGGTGGSTGGGTGSGDSGTGSGGDDGGKDEDKGSYSGEGCDAPPSCTGDAVMCGVALEAHKNRCAFEKSFGSSAATPDVSGPGHAQSEIVGADVDVGSMSGINTAGLSLGNSCPFHSGPIAQIGDQQLSMDFGPICEYGPYMRYFILVLASIACGYIMSGNTRSGGII